MSFDNGGNFMRSVEVDNVVSEITSLLKPDKIYLYNQRINSRKNTTSFKLCVIARVGDKYSSERDVYVKVDCEIPFDVMIYTPDEWEKLTSNPFSFATKILNTGTVVYHA